MRKQRRKRQWERSLDPQMVTWSAETRRWLWWAIQVFALLLFFIGLVLGVSFMLLLLWSMIAPVDRPAGGW